MKNNKVNPFLVQRQFNQAIRSLSKEKKRLVAEIIINVVNDAKTIPIHQFKCKYLIGDSNDC